MRANGFVKFSVSLFIVAGLLLVLGKSEWFPEFYKPKFMGILAFIFAFLIVLPALIFRLPDTAVNSVVKRKQKSLTDLQTAIGVALFMDSAGALGLYQLHKVGFEYDKLSHFIVAFILIITSTEFILNWYGVTFKRSLVLAAALLMCGEFLWEFIEYSTDFLFGTKTFGLGGEDIIRDTVLDLVFDALGIIIGAIALNLKRNKKRPHHLFICV